MEQQEQVVEQKDTRTPTAEQQAAIDEIVKAFSGPRGKMLKLTGSAGAGKSFTVAHVKEQLEEEGRTVIVTATTNCAASILQEQSGEGMTIHSFLCLRMSRDGKGGYHLVRNPDWEERIGLSPDTDAVVIVDEASMIGSLLWAYIEDAAATFGGLCWLFVGDPAQLDPVNDEPSPALSLDGPHLDTIMRYAGAKLELATKIREGNVPPINSSITAKDEIYLIRDAERAFSNAAKGIREAREKGLPLPDVRFAAWRNRSVDKINTRIRTEAFGDHANEYEIGDACVALAPHYRKFDFVDKMGRLREGTTCVIQNAQTFTVTFAQKMRLLGFDSWMLDITYKKFDVDVSARIPVLSASEKHRYKAVCKNLQEEANRLRSVYLISGDEEDAKAAEAAQERAYEYKEAFVPIRYAFAQTVHKLQGATHDNVFVDVNDIMGNRTDYKRLLYVAITRARSKVIFVT